MNAKQLHRDLVRKAREARASDDHGQFDRVWARMNRLEQALYDVEEWHAELKLRSKAKFSGSFMPPIPPKEQLKMLEELERFCGDDFTAARIERVRRSRCFCDWPDADEELIGGTAGDTMRPGLAPNRVKSWRRTMPPWMIQKEWLAEARLLNRRRNQRRN